MELERLSDFLQAVPDARSSIGPEVKQFEELLESAKTIEDFKNYTDEKLMASLRDLCQYYSRLGTKTRTLLAKLATAVPVISDTDEVF